MALADAPTRRGNHRERRMPAAVADRRRAAPELELGTAWVQSDDTHGYLVLHGPLVALEHS